MKKILFMAALLLTFYACNNSDSKTVPPKKGSSGKTLELMVVANKDVYVGETKEFIDSMFGSPQPCLIVPESKFDIVNIPKTSFENTEMFHNYRNVLLLDINPDNPNKVYMHIDEYAAPQVVVDFATKDRASLRELLKKYESKILDEFYKAEHRRIYKAFKGIEGYDLNKAIRDQFGFGLMFSNEFTIAKKDKNFAWVRKEAKDFGIGVWIQVIPYKSQEDFEEERILDRLDTIIDLSSLESFSFSRLEILLTVLSETCASLAISLLEYFPNILSTVFQTSKQFLPTEDFTSSIS